MKCKTIMRIIKITDIYDVTPTAPCVLDSEGIADVMFTSSKQSLACVCVQRDVLSRKGGGRYEST